MPLITVVLGTAVVVAVGCWLPPTGSARCECHFYPEPGHRTAREYRGFPKTRSLYGDGHGAGFAWEKSACLHSDCHYCGGARLKSLAP